MPTDPSATPGFPIGTLIDRRYRVVGSVGSGGMGSILLAEHIQFQRQVAIKVLTPSASDPRARERFQVEARAICHLQHPNLVTYHDFGADPETGLLYLVIELLRGKDLAKVIAKEQPIPLSRAVRIIGQLCDALGEAHAHGVVHRDLKPANIMLVRRGDDPDVVKLIDFGIARAAHLPGADLTGKHKIIGTTGYLAPEYIARQEVTPKVDLYAVGIIAYELVKGTKPFVGDPQSVMLAHLGRLPEPLRELADGRLVPPGLNRVILRALAKDPSERFESAAQLKAHLFAAARPLLDEGAAEPTEQGLRVPDSSTTSIDFAPSQAVPEEPPALTSPKRRPAHLTRTELLGPQRTPWLWMAGVVAAVIGAGTFFLWPPAAASAPSMPGSASSASSAAVSPPAPAAAPPSEAKATASVARREEEPALNRRDRRSFSLVAPRTVEAEASDAGSGEGRVAAAPAALKKAAPARIAKTLVVRPFGDVYLGGRLLGRDRFEAKLAAGRNCFRVVNSTGAESRPCVEVRDDGQNVLLTL